MLTGLSRCCMPLAMLINLRHLFAAGMDVGFCRTKAHKDHVNHKAWCILFYLLSINLGCATQVTWGQKLNLLIDRPPKSSLWFMVISLVQPRMNSLSKIKKTDFRHTQWCKILRVDLKLSRESRTDGERAAAQQNRGAFHALPDSEFYTTEYIPK